MIPIYESIMSISVKAGSGLSLIKIIQKDSFINFIKSLYDNKYDASMDVAVAINNICDSAFANPVLCDLYQDGKKLDGWFIKINNEYYDLLSRKNFSGVDCIESTRRSRVSTTDKFWDVANYLESEYDKYLLNISEQLSES